LRQALHAWRLAFDHPRTRARVVLHACVPNDMRSLIEATRLSAGLESRSPDSIEPR
jgi:23S rRNA pseudouridine1911/1915/1917 synthase